MANIHELSNVDFSNQWITKDLGLRRKYSWFSWFVLILTGQKEAHREEIQLPEVDRELSAYVRHEFSRRDQLDSNRSDLTILQAKLLNFQSEKGRPDAFQSTIAALGEVLKKAAPLAEPARVLRQAPPSPPTASAPREPEPSGLRRRVARMSPEAQAAPVVDKTPPIEEPARVERQSPASPPLTTNSSRTRKKAKSTAPSNAEQSLSKSSSEVAADSSPAARKKVAPKKEAKPSANAPSRKSDVQLAISAWERQHLLRDRVTLPAELRYASEYLGYELNDEQEKEFAPRAAELICAYRPSPGSSPKAAIQELEHSLLRLRLQIAGCTSEEQENLVLLTALAQTQVGALKKALEKTGVPERRSTETARFKFEEQYLDDEEIQAAIKGSPEQFKALLTREFRGYQEAARQEVAGYQAHSRHREAWFEQQKPYEIFRCDQFEKPEEVLGGGVCFAVACEIHRMHVRNPKLSLKQIAHRGSDAGRWGGGRLFSSHVRFDQAAYDLLHSQTEFLPGKKLSVDEENKISRELPPSFMKRMGFSDQKTLPVAHFSQYDGDRGETLASKVDFLIKRHKPPNGSAVVMLDCDGYGHALTVRMDERAGRFEFFDSTSGGYWGGYASAEALQKALADYLDLNYPGIQSAALVYGIR